MDVATELCVSFSVGGPVFLAFSNQSQVRDVLSRCQSELLQGLIVALETSVGQYLVLVYRRSGWCVRGTGRAGGWTINPGRWELSRKI